MIYTSIEQIAISGCTVNGLTKARIVYDLYKYIAKSLSVAVKGLTKARIAYDLYKYRANRYQWLCSEGSYQSTDALVM